jgi:hypothetical protein
MIMKTGTCSYRGRYNFILFIVYFHTYRVKELFLQKLEWWNNDINMYIIILDAKVKSKEKKTFSIKKNWVTRFRQGIVLVEM